MIRIFKLCKEWKDFDRVSNLMDEDYVLDPDIYGGKPLRLENAVVYHLIKYGEGERPVESTEPTVETVVEVKIGNDPEVVKTWIGKGFRVKAFYSGKVQLVKYRDPISNTKEVIK